jgi:CheY-like chemotaxis protein
MRFSQKRSPGRPGFSLATRWMLAGCVMAGAAAQSWAQTGRASASDAPVVRIPPEATVESLFGDFLHYARLGRFTVADTHARALLAHPDLTPVAVLDAANKDRKSLDTLLILLKNATLGDSAARVLELIELGEYERRKDPELIRRNIEWLGGDPQQEFYAIRHLAASGEYAIPEMVQVLFDQGRKGLWPRLIRAFPLMGKSAVSLLVMAIRTDNEDVRQHLIRALGEIGYPQAVPYLRQLTHRDGLPDETKQAARAAIARIEEISGRMQPGSVAELFFNLAERYYNEDDAVRADPRFDQANVWYWDDSAQSLKRVVVPTKIFGSIMAMRTTHEALSAREDDTDSLALWLAANTRREARLGFDIESADPSETAEDDPTRPDVFPRALYFTQTAGPRYAHLMLARAIRDDDSHVALAAIEALRVTAGESSLVGTEDHKQPLVQALQFPDISVRIKAALALGAALPKSQFAGLAFVVPVLASTLHVTGRDQVLVIGSNESEANRIAEELRRENYEVIQATNFYRGLERSRIEQPALSGLFLASDITDPDASRAMQELRAEFRFARTPVVLLTQPDQSLLAEELVSADRYLEPIDAAAGGAGLIDAFSRAGARANRVPIEPDEALALALEAAETLRAIAVDGRTAYQLDRAESSLIAALSSPHEELQMMAASVLALLPTDTAQRAIAHVALDLGNTDSLRMAAFASLAESARNHGHRLEPDHVSSLIDIAANEPDLTMRTAASQALGAINLAGTQASEIIRGYYGG